MGFFYIRPSTHTKFWQCCDSESAWFRYLLIWVVVASLLVIRFAPPIFVVTVQAEISLKSSLAAVRVCLTCAYESIFWWIYQKEKQNVSDELNNANSLFLTKVSTSVLGGWFVAFSLIFYLIRIELFWEKSLRYRWLRKVNSDACYIYESSAEG